MLKVEGLLKIYGRKAVLKDLDFLVEEGERVFILAPNGYGKTTFLKILANIEPFQKGEITLYDTKIPSAKSRRLISYVSERDNLYPGFKIYEILKFVGSFWEINGDLFENFLGLLNLDTWRRYGEFSKGERTLIRIAIGLSINTKLYLIDEPLSSLDFVLREKVVRMMKEKGEGTFIFTSHQIDELSDFATRFVFLKNGKFVEETFERDRVKDIYKELFV